MKIRSFAHKGLKRFYAEDSMKGGSPGSADKLRKMLAFLDDMEEAEELHLLPAWRAHMLSGDRKGTWLLGFEEKGEKRLEANRGFCDALGL